MQARPALDPGLVYQKQGPWFEQCVVGMHFSIPFIFNGEKIRKSVATVATVHPRKQLYTSASVPIRPRMLRLEWCRLVNTPFIIHVVEPREPHSLYHTL